MLLSDQTAYVCERGSDAEVIQMLTETLWFLGLRPTESIENIVSELEGDWGLQFEREDNGNLSICKKRPPSAPH